MAVEAAGPLIGRPKQGVTADMERRPEITAQGVGHAMADLLECPTVGDDDDFFRLGGHSMLATSLANRLRATYGVHVPLADIFENPTPRLLAVVLGSAAPARPAIGSMRGDDGA